MLCSMFKVSLNAKKSFDWPMSESTIVIYQFLKNEQ